MKLFAILFAALAAALPLAPAAHAQPHGQDVTITVTDVQARSGHLLGALYTQDNFLHGRGAYDVTMAPPAQPGTIVMVFHHVAPGTYAFSTVHDENDDHQMRKNAHGMPLEGWAFSHGDALMGPPSFAATSFAVGDQPVSLTVHMFYPYVPAGE